MSLREHHHGDDHAGHDHAPPVPVRPGRIPTARLTNPATTAPATPTTTAAATATAADARRAAVVRARVLNRITIGWNAVEGVVAVIAGLAAGSVSLVGFGLDSAIEVSAAAILAWRLHQEHRGGCMQESDRRATRAIALSFAALAAYVAVESARDLLHGSRPEVSIPGLVLATMSLLMMPALARAKRRLAGALGSRAVVADAAQTNLCAMLSGVLLLGLGANAAFGWWWADPLAGLGIAVLASLEATRTWRAESLEDTCCA